jgi:BCD family chlorophyll transporter-like MFS transporter
MSKQAQFSWPDIFRIGLVQAAIGSVVVLTTSTLNRVMVVELALPAALPGALVAAHYFIQITRPRFGHGSDVGGSRTPWIIGGMSVLAAGGILAAMATALMASSTTLGIALAALAFLMIGAGVGACGTSLLVLLAAGVDAQRRAPAATVTWVMMIASFAITAGSAGALLDPFSYPRLIMVTSGVSLFALGLTCLAVWRLEARLGPRNTAIPLPPPASGAEPQSSFSAALRDVLTERHTRTFSLFVFVSMLAYSAQDLVMEPFAGAVFGLTPGQSTQLGGVQHSGVLAGMICIALIGRLAGNSREDVLRSCMFIGCLGSAALLASLAVAGFNGPPWPLHLNVMALGFANGAFAVAAIGSMMRLVSEGGKQRDGMRMGVFGAAQAIAFGLGGMVGTLSIDISRWLTGSVSTAYALVFCAQALLFATAAWLALGVKPAATAPTVTTHPTPLTLAQAQNKA